MLSHLKELNLYAPVKVAHYCVKLTKAGVASASQSRWRIQAKTFFWLQLT